MRELGARLGELLPSELGAPDAVARLVHAGVGLAPIDGLLALPPSPSTGRDGAVRSSGSVARATR